MSIKDSARRSKFIKIIRFVKLITARVVFNDFFEKFNWIFLLIIN